ncbi:putative histidine phosphatase superfamily [Helianthus anomalus]
MQTAVGAFGGEAAAIGIDRLPLMVENTGSSNCPAISSLNCPPFIAMELCRESMIEPDSDVWWSPDTREKKEDVAARGEKFMKWLLTREEKVIVVVSHAVFLHRTFGAYGDDCHPTIKKEMSIP